MSYLEAVLSMPRSLPLYEYTGVSSDVNSVRRTRTFNKLLLVSRWTYFIQVYPGLKKRTSPLRCWSWWYEWKLNEFAFEYWFIHFSYSSSSHSTKWMGSFHFQSNQLCKVIRKAVGVLIQQSFFVCSKSLSKNSNNVLCYFNFLFYMLFHQHHF